MGRGGEGREIQEEWACVYLWLIHTDVWQKLTQFCTATSFQFKKKGKKKKKIHSSKNVQYKLTLRSESK